MTMKAEIKKVAKFGVLSMALGMVLTTSGYSFESATRLELENAAPAAAKRPEYYEFRNASRGGTGKFYMGREISRVMGYQGASWLDRPNRERDQRTDLLIENLPLEADSVVADIGAGTGYFSFPIAERVPEGRVLAVDIQPQMLAIIEDRIARGAPSNVETVLGNERDTGLPKGAVDLILLVDAYHEFSYPREMGEAMVRALKPGGRMVLIEYRGEDMSIPIKPLHKMTEQQVIAEMLALGLEWERTEDFLPQQHFLVFRLPLDQPAENPASD